MIACSFTPIACTGQTATDSVRIHKDGFRKILLQQVELRAATELLANCEERLLNERLNSSLKDARIDNFQKITEADAATIKILKRKIFWKNVKSYALCVSAGILTYKLILK